MSYSKKLLTFQSVSDYFNTSSNTITWPERGYYYRPGRIILSSFNTQYMLTVVYDEMMQGGSDTGARACLAFLKSGNNTRSQTGNYAAHLTHRADVPV